MPALLIALTLCTPSPILSSGELSASLALAVVPEGRLELQRELSSLREKRAQVSTGLGWTLIGLSAPLLGAGIPLLVAGVEWLNSLTGFQVLLGLVYAWVALMPLFMVIGGVACLAAGTSILLVAASFDSQIASIEEQLQRTSPAPPGVTLRF